MKNRKLNEKESIELIAKMIQNTQQNVNRGGGNLFIIWGVSTLLTSIILFGALLLTSNPFCQFAWFLIPIIGCVWQRKATSGELVVTHLDKMLKTVWLVCGIFSISIPLLAWGFNYFHAETLLANNAIFLFIPLLEILIVSLGVAVSGILLDSKPLRMGGFLGMGISFCSLVDTPYMVPYTFAIWSIVCLIIPGIKLNRAIKRSLSNV